MTRNGGSRALRAGARLFAVAALCASAAHAENNLPELALDGEKAVVWLPRTPKRVPLVVYSHGYSGCHKEDSVLYEPLVKHGYALVAPQHDDNGCTADKDEPLKPEQPFREPENWTKDTYLGRAEDVRTVVAALKKDERFNRHIDFSRVALMGHSLGGFTAISIASGWPGWKLPGVKAVLAFAPLCSPFTTHRTMRTLSVPVMFQNGTLDHLPTLMVKHPNGCYDQARAPKYFVEFQGFDHHAWVTHEYGPLQDTTDKEKLISTYALAFLDHYVKGAPAQKALYTLLPRVYEMEYDSELGRKHLFSASARKRMIKPGADAKAANAAH